MNFDRRFPTAYGEALTSATLKTRPQDFIVDELLAFPLSGQGEHLYLHIRKTNANTEWVCRQLARHLGVRQRDIGYAGLKDRHAVTSQWLSLPATGLPAARLESLQIEGVELLDRVRHDRKLRRGAIRENRFSICLRDVVADATALQQRLGDIARHGVPNYFDEQRFGRQRANLEAAVRMFRRQSRPDRHMRSLYLSAARAWLFNQILARRVTTQSWRSALPGDVFALEGSKRFFGPAELDAEIHARLLRGDIHPTGALWGKGATQSGEEVARLETEQIGQWPELAEGLCAAGLEQDRRALRVLPRQLSHDYDPAGQTLHLQFALGPGSYATAVLRELFELTTLPASAPA